MPALSLYEQARKAHLEAGEKRYRVILSQTREETTEVWVWAKDASEASEKARSENPSDWISPPVTQDTVAIDDASVLEIEEMD